MKQKQLTVQDFEALLSSRIAVPVLSPAACMDWIAQNRSRNRVFFPEVWAVLAPMEPKYLCDMLGYALPEAFPKQNHAILFLSDLKMKHFYARTVITFQIAENSVTEAFADGGMIRIRL